MSVAKERGDDGAWIGKPEGMAAALELCVSELLDNVRPPLKKELVEIYGVSHGTLARYYEKLFEDTGDRRFD